MRVFELAKKIGMPTKELLNLLKKMDIKVNNHMTALEESDVQLVMKKKDRLPSKVASKGAKTAKAASLAPPPTVEKKSRVLIKKRPTPEEIAATEALATKTEELQKEAAPPEPSV
ncbi:MAG TPA: translation initiation factor IF-2 N-terminal domain-containing protein, partial [Candidatus Manganitrophaceae bacterium]|nr:translation initiation factor IF-2 N-terminal domain-containing protein [Candidatus Manganitrophaceae bacterium]